MKNFFLFIFSIIASLILAYPLGYLTRHDFPLGFAGYLVNEGTNEFINGIGFAYVLSTPIIFMIFGNGRRWLKIFILSLPIIILLAVVDPVYASWSALFFAAGVIIAGIIEQVRSK